MKYLLPAIIFALASGCLIATAQQSPLLPTVKLSDFNDAKPTQCQYRGADLDVMHQRTPADDSIIVIARLGDGEAKPELNWRRLHNVRVYWTEFLSEGYRRKPETIILAAGDRVRGYGHLEFYVSGNLVHVMKVARSADLFIGECYPPDDTYIRNGAFNACEVKSNKNFYPCRDNRVSPKRKR